ncbi:hypothetical protein ACIGBL_05535 [Streptomyces sp. NPDC085614]|uniref:hypothetical protein n=1 Tax=Streptomyces sp. NPDC085614 TaxID=3365733 RepID=UPI0037D1C2E9
MPRIGRPASRPRTLWPPPSDAWVLALVLAVGDPEVGLDLAKGVPLLLERDGLDGQGFGHDGPAPADATAGTGRFESVLRLPDDVAASLGCEYQGKFQEQVHLPVLASPDSFEDLERPMRCRCSASAATLQEPGIDRARGGQWKS